MKSFVERTHKTNKSKEKKKDKKEEDEMRKILDFKVDAFETWMHSFCDANGYRFSKASQTRFFVDGVRVDLKYKIIDKESMKLFLVTEDDLCDQIQRYMEKDPCMEILSEISA